MKIAICDDEKIHTEYLCDMIYKNFNYVNIDIYTFSDGNKLIDAIKIGEYFDIIFLDIIMPNFNGIDIARKIKEIKPELKFCFLTSTPDFVFDGYDLDAVNYLMKPINIDKLKKVIEKIMVKDETSDLFVIKNKNSIQKVDLKYVEYFEIIGRIVTAYININGNQSTIEFYYKMSDLVNELTPKGFIKSHRSILVNVRHIDRINDSNIILNSGKEIILSRNNLNDVKKAFTEYLQTTL